MELRKKFAAAALAAVTIVSGCGNNNAPAETTTAAPAETTTASEETTPSREIGEMREMTTQQIVEDMGLGINLGNTFEATGSKSETVSGYERSWGSPIISKELIEGYAKAGFGVLRVPVAWSNLMAEDYTISPELLARVDEVMGWAMDSGMYVIMNIHWDGGWWDKFPTEKEECMKKYTRIWEQLSDYYGNYGDKLMFESLNEEGGWQSIWNRYSGTAGEEKEQSFALLNEINQKFVDIVRASGGNNAKRHLLIAGYNTDFDLTCDDLFVMPTDPAGRCAVSMHYYTPSTFCILEKDADWGKAKKTWGTKRDVREMEMYMDKVKEHFVDKGVPVIVGEYGCVAVKNKTKDQIRLFNLLATEEMVSRKICPVLWDTTGVFYDRYLYVLKDEEFQKGLDRIRAGESLKDELLAEASESSGDKPAETDSAA